MSAVEKIMRGIQPLSPREQVEVARYVYRLDVHAQEERSKMLGRTHGALNDADGEAFESAIKESRRIEAHG